MELVEQTLIENRLREAEIYAKQGLIDEALEVYRTLRDLVSEEEDGLKEEIQKRILELEAFRGSVSEELLSKGAEEEKFKKALTLKEGAFYQEAAKLLEELARESPRTEVYSHLADCFTALGEHEKAANCLRQALRLFPLTPENRLEYLELKKRLAEELEKAYEFEQALIVYQDLERELLGEEKEQVQEKIAFLRDLVQGASQLKFLFKEKVLTPSVCKEALEIAKEEGASIESVLIEKFGISKELIGQALSRFYNCPFWEFKEGLLLKKPDCLEGVKETFLKQLLVAPLLREDGGLALVISNPFDINALEQAKKILKIKDFELLVALREDILKLLDYYYGHLQQYPETAPLLEILPEEETVEEEEEGIPEDQESVVVQFANYLLEEAYNRGASDIHIESLTGRRGAQIRFRIDGECIPFQTVPYQMKRPLISRYKIMAGLDIAEKRLPQDGKIKFRTRTGKVFEVRVATIPTIENNEDIVMRILGGVEARTLEEINLRPEILEKFKKILEMPYGLILVVGPTGSGKTTTLHAALHYINRPSKKIWTAEDPVEIVQEGLRQVQVRHKIGLTFARVLRAFLRADPDVIMIGETRDEETAHALIEASLTGHLVFSTLHTNSAPETVTRLLGMGIDPYNFADALLGILAQRLAKRLCPDCKEPYQPTEKEIEELLFEYGTHPLHPLTEEEVRKATLYRPVGCPRCHQTGYRGRIALHELLIPNEELRELIVKAAPVHNIRETAMRNGMFTLKQDGIFKVLAGETDLKQVRAVCVR